MSSAQSRLPAHLLHTLRWALKTFTRSNVIVTSGSPSLSLFLFLLQIFSKPCSYLGEVPPPGLCPKASICWACAHCWHCPGQHKLRYNLQKPCACSQVKSSLSFSLMQPPSILRMSPTLIHLAFLIKIRLWLSITCAIKFCFLQVLNHDQIDNGHYLFLCPNWSPFSYLPLCPTILHPHLIFQAPLFP